jgi:hypothetical protein|tara:strand:+ start:415 stop:645 length:231 start_codon:yes stop_codon:yes gene_type:complete
MDEVHACWQYTTAHPSSGDPCGVPMAHGISVVDLSVFTVPGRVLMQQQQPLAEHSSMGAAGRPWKGSTRWRSSCLQ